MNFKAGESKGHARTILIELKSAETHFKAPFQAFSISASSSLQYDRTISRKLVIRMVITRGSKPLTSFMQIERDFALPPRTYESPRNVALTHDSRIREIYPSERDCIRRSAGQDTYDLFDGVLSKLRYLYKTIRIDLTCRWLRRVSPFKITEINGQVHAFLAVLNLINFPFYLGKLYILLKRRSINEFDLKYF